jgi:hypothetical protein
VLAHIEVNRKVENCGHCVASETKSDVAMFPNCSTPDFYKTENYT